MRPRLRAGLPLLALIAAAGAAPRPAQRPLPLGPLLSLPRCAPDPAAACWDQAPRLPRWAPGVGLEGEAIALDPAPRLAWDARGLLLWLPALPPDSAVEWGVAPEGQRLAQAVPGRAEQPGVHRLTTPKPTAAGQGLELAISLRGPVDRGIGARFPADVGPGRPTRLAHLLLTEAGGLDLPFSVEPPGLPLTLESSGAALVATAPGAALRAELDEVAPPLGSRGPEAPWSVEGKERLSIPAPPSSGWLQISARWPMAGGVLADQRAIQRYVEVPGPAGLRYPDAPVPPPRAPAAAAGAPFRASPGLHLCGPEAWAPALAVVKAEWARVVGLPLAEAGRCALRFIEDPALGPEALELRLSAKGAELRASSRRAALWAGLLLVDHVGPDGIGAPLQLQDAPAIPRRILYRSLNTKAVRGWSLEDERAFLRQIVSRGRYNEVHYALNDSLSVPGFEALAHHRALRPADLAALLAELEGMGVEAVPAINSPDHTDWLVAAWPELTEDVNQSLIDVRHPEALPRLMAWADAYVALFPDARRVHLGHDEVAYQSDRWFEDEQNPRTAGTPRALLLADELSAWTRWAAAKGLKVDVWDDIFVPEWNGNKDGAWRTLDLMPPDLRAQLSIMAWSSLGDPVRRFGGPEGKPVTRVHTGYQEWKRAGVEADQAAIAGEGLGLFVPCPWLSFGNPSGSRALSYHFTSVLLAGWTAWRPELARAAIAPSLVSLADHPAMQPGLQSRGPLRLRPIPLSGPAPAGPSAVRWPKAVGTLGLDQAPTPVEAHHGRPLSLAAGPLGATDGIRLLWADRLDHDAEQLLLARTRAGAKPADRAAAVVEWRYADGQTAQTPIEHGLDIDVLNGDPRAVSLWRTAGSLGLPSPEAAADSPEARDRRLYRRDLRSPRPGVELVEITLQVSIPGVHLLVAAAALEEPR